MELKDEVNEVRQEVNEMSFAMEMIQFAKTQTDKNNKRLFVIILILILCLGLSIGYNIYLLNDITEVETEYTQEVTDVDNIGGNLINNGDVYGESKANNKDQKEN